MALDFGPCKSPQVAPRLLHHRKRRVRRRAIVRLCRQFRQWCRRVRDGSIPMHPKHRAYYAQFADQPIAEAVREEIRSREGRRWLNHLFNAGVRRRTLTCH